MKQTAGEDVVLEAIRGVLLTEGAVHSRLRKRGIGAATIYRILEGRSPVASNSLSAALDEFGYSIRVVKSR